jgi:integrase
MGHYTTDIKTLLFEEDARAMLNKCKTEKERRLLALLWLTAGRPAELNQVKKEDIVVFDETISIRLKTLKLGRSKHFQIENRTLEYERPKGLQEIVWLDIIARAVIATPPDTFLLAGHGGKRPSTRWISKTINRISFQALGKRFAPYHIRHSVLSSKAAANYSIDQLMHMKGAKSVESVSPYLHARPFVIKLQAERSFRESQEQEAQPLPEPVAAPAPAPQPEPLPATPAQSTEPAPTITPKPKVKEEDMAGASGTE